MIHSLQQKGLTIQLSSQYLLPAASRTSMAVILTKCWCHLLWAGEVAGIFPLAAFFLCAAVRNQLFGFFFLRRQHPTTMVIVFFPRGGKHPDLSSCSLPWWRRAGRSRPQPGLAWGGGRPLGRPGQQGLGTPGCSQLPLLLRYASMSLVFINKRYIQ